MTFVQPAFVALLAVVLTLWWGMPLAGEARRRAQNVLLLLASAVFYGWVHPWYLGLLVFSTLLDFGVGLGMVRWPAARRLLLGLSLAGNLGLLGAFKYLGFFVDNVAAMLATVGFTVHLPTLQLALPVGISFFTFQTMSYTLDVYRGRVEPRRSLLDYAVFVSMFPQLVAGPVERARSLLPQIERPRSFSAERLRSGLSLALWGATKKIVVADTLALYVDRVFALDHAGPVLTWAATLGFAVQILADFSGYTDIARGTARMLGFELMENFRSPYRATSPADFWRRWHISFSSWIHEYLYAPLRGRSPSWLRRTAATWGSLLASGLWHGASWNFVLWGGYHAALLTGYRAIQPRVPAALRRLPGAGLAATGGMFIFTCVGWLIFRQGDFDQLVWALRWAPWGGSADEVVAAGVMTSVALAGAAVLASGSAVERHLVPRLTRSPWRLAGHSSWWALAAVLVFVFARDVADDFIYFRF